MITTEEEAKTKLCHEAIGPGVTGWAFVPIERRCAASECMAWRYFIPKPDEAYDPIIIDGKIVLTGFCGKAGRP